MKNKVLVITVAVLIVVALISLIYIVFNGNRNNDVTNDVADNETINNDVEDDEDTEDDGENIAVDSRIGINILKNLDFVITPYSNLYFDELDSYGISDKAKIIAGYMKITSKEEYSDMIKDGEDYTYFSKEDLESVVESTFSDSKNMSHMSAIEKDSYIAQEGKYIVISRGFSNLNYALEIPYKIIEYEDKVEVYSYRIYIKSENSVSEEEVVKNVDRAMQDEALRIENQEFRVDENSQKKILKENITSGKIDESKLTSVIYELKKNEDSYLISDYRKGK